MSDPSDDPSDDPTTAHDPGDTHEIDWVTADRSEGPAERFATAALQLLEDGDSFDEISVAQLAKAAGGSVGAFYARFPNKTALMHHLQAALDAEGRATIDRAMDVALVAPIPLAALVRGLVDLAVSINSVQRGLRRAILVQMTRDHVMREHTVALSVHTLARLVALATRNFPGVAPDRIALTMDTVHRMITGTLDQRLLYGTRSPTGREVEDSALAAELTMAVLAYMQATLGSPAPPSPP